MSSNFNFSTKSIEPLVKTRTKLQEFIKIHFENVPIFSKNIQTLPMFVPFEEFKIQQKLQKLIQKCILIFVNNYFKNEKFQEIIPLDEKIKNIFNKTKRKYKDKDIGSYRPDFIYDSENRIKICEINARFTVNGYFISDYLNFAVHTMEDFSEFRDTLQFEVYKTFLSNFDENKSIGCVRKREKGYDLKFLLQKNFKSRSVDPDDLYLKNAKLYDSFGVLDQVILELHQDELLNLSEEILLHLIENTKCVNDLRTIFLIHDKRFLKFLSNKSLLYPYLNEEDAEFLSSHVILSRSFSKEEIEKISQNHEKWILKPFLKGKGEGILFGKDFNKKEWMDLMAENQTSCVLQEYISPKLFAFDVEENEEIKSYPKIPIVGTFLCLNEYYLGPGIYRISPSDIIAISRGGGVIISLVQKLPCRLSIHHTTLEKDENIDTAKVYKILKQHEILTIQLNFNDDGKFMNNLVSEFGISQLYWDIQLNSEMDQNTCARSKTLKKFDFHTDASFDDPCPNYISIFVIQPDELGGGIFQMVSVKDILKQLNDEEIELLQQNFEFIVPEEFQRNKNKTMKGKILFSNESMRYRSDIIIREGLSEKSLAVLDKVDSILQNEKFHHCFDFEKNRILIFNNHKFLHARTMIKDKSRHLKRIQFFGK
jgi:hypothetical protein